MIQNVNYYLIRAGLEAKGFLKEVFRPYMEEVVNPIMGKIRPQVRPQDAGSIIQRLFSRFEEPISTAVTVFFSIGIIFFIYKAAIQAPHYFNSENANERAQALDKIKMSLFGAAFCLAGGVIINIILGIFERQGWQVSEEY